METEIPTSENASRSFVDRLKKDRRPSADLIYLVRGNDSTGRAAWYYFQVLPSKKLRFEVEVKRGQIQLTDYGKILVSGYGTTPPDDVKSRMKEEFGYQE